MQNIKLILFDIDNTLVYGDEAKKFYGRYSRVLEERLALLLGVNVEEAKRIADHYRKRYNGQGEKAYEELLGDISLWYDSILTIRPKEYLIKNTQINELLRMLRKKGYMLGAITDGPTKQAEIILKTVGIRKEYFSLFLGWEAQSDRPKGGKSDVFQKVAALYNLSPEQIVMVGDSLGTDILPAIEARVQAIHITDKSKSDEQWRTITNVFQLAEIF